MLYSQINEYTNRNKPINQSSIDYTVIENDLLMLLQMNDDLICLFMVLKCWDLKGIVFCYIMDSVIWKQENDKKTTRDLHIRKCEYFFHGTQKSDSNLISKWLLYPFSNFLPNLD